MFTESRLFFECQKCSSFFVFFSSVVRRLFDVLMSAQAYSHKHQTKDLRLLFSFFPSFVWVYLSSNMCVLWDGTGSAAGDGGKTRSPICCVLCCLVLFEGEEREKNHLRYEEGSSSLRETNYLVFACFFHAPLAVKWFFYVGKNWELTTVLANFFLRSIRRRSGGVLCSNL